MSSEASGAPASPVASRQSRDASVLVMGRVLSTVSDALLPLIIVRLLGKAEVGVLGSVLLVYQTVALILATGFPAALMYQLPGRALAERRAISTRMAAGLFGFGVVAAALLAGTGALTLFAPELTQRLFSSGGPALAQGGLAYLFLLAAFPLGDLPARMLPNLLVIEGHAGMAARFAIAKSIGNALFVLVPASLGLGIHAVIVSYSVFGVAQGFVLLYFLRALYAGAPVQPPPVSFAETVRFALPLGATDIVSQLSSRLDRYLVAASFSAAMFAEYHVGAFQIPILTTVAYSIGTAYTPTFTQLLRAGKAREAIAIWRGTIEKTSLIVVPCSAIFVIAAEPLMELLFTKSYSHAASVFRWYALVTAGRVAAFGSVIVAAGKPRLVLRAGLVTLAANAVLSYGGLQLFGFEGPAVGTCIAFIPTVIAYCHYIARATGLQTREIFPGLAYLKVLVVGAVSALPALAFERLVAGPPALMILGVAVLVLSVFTLLGRSLGLISTADLTFLKQRLWPRRARAGT